METRIVVSEHARTRISERGGDIVTITSTVRQASSRILSASVRAGSRRVALKIPAIPTIPIVEVSPRQHGVSLVVITVLPQPTGVISHPVVVA